MGEAFDRDGQVLGDAYGETKREVFEKLNAAHPEAAEIRIRRFEQEVAAIRERSLLQRERSLLQQFAGWLSADLAELHGVEVPRLTDSVERFLAVHKDA